MNSKLIIFSFVFALIIIIAILYLIRKEKINIKYAIVWILLFGIFASALIIPNLLYSITNFLGFEISSNMIFAIFIGALIILTISLTAIVSTQDKKIRILIQEMSMLKNKIGDNNDTR